MTRGSVSKLETIDEQIGPASNHGAPTRLRLGWLCESCLRRRRITAMTWLAMLICLLAGLLLLALIPTR